MPDSDATHICFKCGAVLPYLTAGCGCVRQCACVHLQDGAKIVCAECAVGIAEAANADVA